MEKEQHHHESEKHVEVAVVTTSGRYPKTGETRVPEHQPVEHELEKAKEHLKIVDTKEWIARVDGREIHPAKTYAENNLTGRVIMIGGPTMAAAAMHSLASRALFEEQTRHLEGDIVEARKWRIFNRDFPTLDIGFEWPGRQPFRIRMDCTDWNELPPSVALLSPDGAYLNRAPTGPPNIFHQGPHPATGRIFICMAGTREYHTFSGHVSDLWEKYRQLSGYDLGGILTQIWDGWLKSTP